MGAAAAQGLQVTGGGKLTIRVNSVVNLPQEPWWCGVVWCGVVVCGVVCGVVWCVVWRGV